MPYMIAARVELGTKIVGRIGKARLVQSDHGLAVHVLEQGPCIAEILRNASRRAAWTYQLKPAPGEALEGIGQGPYPDLSAIKDAVENYSKDTCAIRISTPTIGSRRLKPIRGAEAEISFDTVVSEVGQTDVEGCYRIARRHWQVFYFTSWWEGQLWRGPPVINANGVWLSGITGVQVVYQNDMIINKSFVKRTLSEVLGVRKWTEVLGPDSLEFK